MNLEVVPANTAPTASHYAHAVVTTESQRMLHTSGIAPINAEGMVPDGIDDQSRVVWTNLLEILAESEMEINDIVSVTTYVVVGQPVGAVLVARDRALKGHRAASTVVMVSELIRPEWLIEIALVAAK
jgi:enamine deaminase RidA (YjgF/YER057c/UK114 family)